MNNKSSKYDRKYKCPYCNDNLTKLQLIDHIEKEHNDMIPQTYTPARVVFNSINKKDHGTCIICGEETKWREDRYRYDRLCSKKSCHDKYVNLFRERMKKVGKDNIMNDPDHQAKMLANRKISGRYKFSDGSIKTYCGSYEKKLLEFLDKIMHYSSNDIMSPGPVIEYEYKGKPHKWILDQYIIPANLAIDVKDGGSNPNTRNMEEYREKQIAKEKAIAKQGEYNYLRLTDNNFEQLWYILIAIKDEMIDPDSPRKKVVHINETFMGGIPPATAPNIWITNNLASCSFSGNYDSNLYLVSKVINDREIDMYLSKDKYLKDMYKLNNGKLEKVNLKNFDNDSNFMMFQYINDNSKELENYIFNNDIDADNIYSMLTGKDIIDNKQIMFDENFVRVLDGYSEAFIKNDIMSNTFNNILKENYSIDIIDSKNKSKKNNIIKGFCNIDIKNDINGYYAENAVSNYRTSSYNRIEDIPYEYICVLDKFL